MAQATTVYFHDWVDESSELTCKPAEGGTHTLHLGGSIGIFISPERLAKLHTVIGEVLAANAMSAHDAGCAITDAAPPPVADERLDGVRA